MSNDELLKGFEKVYGGGKYVHIKNIRRCASRWSMGATWSDRIADSLTNIRKLCISASREIAGAVASGVKR